MQHYESDSTIEIAVDEIMDSVLVLSLQLSDDDAADFYSECCELVHARYNDTDYCPNSRFNDTLNFIFRKYHLKF